MSFSEWKKYKLGEVATFSYGKMPKRELLGQGDFITFSGYRYQDQYPLSNCYRGDLIVVARGVGGTGDVKLVKRTCYLTNLSIQIKLDTKFASNFFVYYNYLNNSLRHLDSGSAQSQITIEDLKRVKIKLPPINIQKHIESLLSSLDDKIELNRQTNQTLEGMVQTLFKEMCFPKSDKLPEGWRVGLLFDICKLMGGGTPKTDKIEYWYNGTIDWISAKDITPNNGSFIIQTEKKITEFGLKSSSAKILPPLSTIISARGTVGNVCIIAKSMTINQSNYALVSSIPDSEYYLFCIVGSLVRELKQRAYGTIFDTITTISLSDLEIIIPKQEFILNFNKIITPIFDLIKNNIQEIQTLTTLRDSLLPKLMKGEIDVNHFPEAIKTLKHKPAAAYGEK